MKTGGRRNILVIDRKAGFLMLGALAVLVGGVAMSEQLTLTTSYPVPSGIYNQLVTTGNSGSAPADTTFNRNAGNTILVPPTNAGGGVGIGTISPGAAFKLDVRGIAAATNLLVNGTAAAGNSCTPNGLVSQDGNGVLLSCQSLVWKAVGGGGSIGGFTFTINGVPGVQMYGVGKYDATTPPTFSGNLICDPATVGDICGSSGNAWCGTGSGAAACAGKAAAGIEMYGRTLPDHYSVGVVALPITLITQKW
jgi:hypothetical protein